MARTEKTKYLIIGNSAGGTMQTDTKVVAYAVDLLMRQHNLPLEIVAKILAPPFWSDIERLKPGEQKLMRAIRQVYGSLLLNRPFAVIIAHYGEMIGLTDRIRLRPLTVGEKGDMLYLSSEESAIRLACPEVDRTRIPAGGESVVGRLKAISQLSLVATREKVTATRTMKC